MKIEKGSLRFQNKIFEDPFRLLFCCTAIFMFIFSNSVAAQNYPDKKLHNLLKNGISNIISHDYWEAEIIFSKMKKDYPELPLGQLYLIAVKISKSVDYGEGFDDEFITKELDSLEEQCENLLKEDENNIWYIYFSALSKGYSAYYQALNRNYISAFTNGLSSISLFEKCLKLDPTFYEAYVAIGTYKYWKSVKTEYLQWLPFISDERETGIKNLELAVRKSSYNQYMAINSLIWIYINCKEYQKAINIAEKVLKKIPENRTFKWSLARAYQNVDKKKSIEVYSGLLNTYQKLPDNNHYNEIVLKHKLAMLYSDIGEKQKALELCNEILKQNGVEEYVLVELQNRLDRVKKLKSELSG